MFVEGVVHSVCVVVACMSKFCVGLGSRVVSLLVMSKSVKSSSESSMLKSKSMSGEEGGSKLGVVRKFPTLCGCVVCTGGAGVLLQERVGLRVQGVGVLDVRVGFRLEGIERVGLRVGRMEATED